MTDLRPDLETLDDATYLAVQQQIDLIVQILHTLPLRAFIARAEAAEAVGPIVDPTLARNAGRALARVRAHAIALRKARSAIELADAAAGVPTQPPAERRGDIEQGPPAAARTHHSSMSGRPVEPGADASAGGPSASPEAGA